MTTTARTARTTSTAARLAALAALTGLTLAACGGATSYSSRCGDGLCTVSLTGAGAEAEVLDDTITVELEGAADGTARFAIDGQPATCAEGDALEVAGYAVVCTEVGDDRLTVEIR